MKILEIKHNPTTVDVTAEIENDVWQSKVQGAIKEQIKKVKIDGFRPGKVPYNIANKYVDRWAIYQKIANKLIAHGLHEIEEDEKFKKDDSEIIGAPSVNFKDVNDEKCILIFEYELSPTVTLSDYKAIEFKKLKELVATEEEVEHEIKEIIKTEKKSKGKNAKTKLDDELVASWKINNVNTVEEFKDWLKNQIIETKKLQNREEAGKQIAKYLLKNAKVSHYPNSYLSDAINTQITTLNNKLAESKITKEQYFEMTGTNQTELMEKINKDAKDAVLVSLALNEIIEKEKIEATDAEINDFIQKLAQLYKVDIDKMSHIVKNDDKYLETIKNSILNNKVIDKIVELNEKNSKTSK